MKRICGGIAFCMVLILFFAMVSCAKPSDPSSPKPSPSSSEPSLPGEAEPVIEPYAITPLDEPMNGGMTYEEYFSVERGESSCEMIEYRFKHLGAREISFKTDAFWGKTGYVWYNDHELYWMTENESEIVLLYRTPKIILLRSVTENLIFWQEITEKRADDFVGCHRFYIPMLRHDFLVSVEDYYKGSGEYYYLEPMPYNMPSDRKTSSTDIVGICLLTVSGSGETFVYSSLSNKTYSIPYIGLRPWQMRPYYVEQRNKDYENLKSQRGK